jgi:hypothetical protein
MESSLTGFSAPGKQTLSKENLQVKTGLPQHKEDNEKNRDQDDKMPTAIPDSTGGVVDKV